jgi:hypothetical protein
VVKLKDELAVGVLALFLFCQTVFAVRGELSDLPLLAFVFAEVLDDEGLHVGDAEQALAGGVDGEASEIAGDPAAVELFGDGSGGAGAAEAVEHEGTFVAAQFHDAYQKRLRFLGPVPKELTISAMTSRFSGAFIRIDAEGKIV